MALRKLRASGAIVAAVAMLATMALVPAASAAPQRYLISFEGSTWAATEGDGPAMITIWRNSPTVETASVTVTTTRGTAIAGSDYTAVDQVVEFGASSQFATVQVPILVDGDGGQVPDETVKLTLRDPSPGWRITNPRRATLTITDMPAPPTPTAPSVQPTSTSLIISWEAPAYEYGALTYEVNVFVPGFGWGTFSAISGTSYTWEGVHTMPYYDFTVSAVSPDGTEGPESPPTHFVT